MCPGRAPVPTLEFNLCQHLIKFVYPELSSGEVGKMVRHRYEKRACPYDTALETEDVEEAACVVTCDIILRKRGTLLPAPSASVFVLLYQ